LNKHKLVPVEPTPEMVEAAREHHEGEAYLPVSLYKAMFAAAPQPQVQQADECGFTELTEKVAEIELAALEEALVKREKALATWEAKGSSGMDEELEAIHKEFHAACYAGRIQNVVYVLKAALADIGRACCAGGSEEGAAPMKDLPKRLRIKAGMIEMCERIAWGSDSALMREAADALDALDTTQLVEALEMARDRLESERRSGEFDPLIKDIDDALAAYRQGG